MPGSYTLTGCRFYGYGQDLGITSFDDLVEKAASIMLLPRLWGVAEAIMEANPDIVVY